MSRLYFGLIHKKGLKLSNQFKYRDSLKKYLCAIKDIDEENIVENNPYPDKIWTMWLQGYDNAPPIVKACIDSIKKYSSGREVILLTEENIFDYVDLPQFIIDKYKKGYISRTHFSDIVRLYLLDKYGGTWMDSTLYCTGKLDYLTDNDIIFFQQYKPKTPLSMSSWFIHTKFPSSYIIKSLLYCEYEYWKRNNELEDYFLLHYFHSMLLKYDKSFKEKWEKIPIYPHSIPHLLIYEAVKPNNKKQIDYIKSITSIHKFSYKNGFFTGVKTDNAPEGSLWYEIVSKYK